MRRALQGFALALSATMAWAWPTKPVTFIVPYPPGGSVGTAVAAPVIYSEATATGQNWP